MGKTKKKKIRYVDFHRGGNKCTQNIEADAKKSTRGISRLPDQIPKMYYHKTERQYAHDYDLQEQLVRT